MPEITLKKKELLAPNKIVLGAAGGKLDFSLTGNIVELDDNSSDVQLHFNGEFNPMMAMMIKGPSTSLLKHWLKVYQSPFKKEARFLLTQILLKYHLPIKFGDYRLLKYFLIIPVNKEPSAFLNVEGLFFLNK